MKNIIVYITTLFFAIYWFTTFFFTFPDNPINVKSMKIRQYFDLYLYQQWSFFAPPATFNEKLYFSYSYTDPATCDFKIKTFEILDSIKKEKTENAPFNKAQDVLDYIVSGSVTDIQNSLKEIYDTFKVEEKENKKNYTNEEKSKKAIKIIEQSYSFSNLLDYAKIIAKNNNIPNNDTEYKITITNVSIPKFLNKDSLDKEREENTIFSSNLYSLKTSK